MLETQTIKKFREELNLSQEQCAKILSLSTEKLIEIEEHPQQSNFIHQRICLIYLIRDIFRSVYKETSDFNFNIYFIESKDVVLKKTPYEQILEGGTFAIVKILTMWLEIANGEFS